MTLKSKTTAPVLALAASILGLAFAATPSYALTAPAMEIAVTNGPILTIDSTGTCYSTAPNAPTPVKETPCPGTVTLGSGTITWNGTLGNFTIRTLVGQTTPAVPAPQIDLGVGSILVGPAGGVITISWTDVNFAVGESPGTMNIGPGLVGSAVYTSYVDTTNAPFGMQTLVGTNKTGGFTTGLGPSTDANKFSMTNVEVITMPAGTTGSFGNDFGFTVAPFPPLALGCGTSSATYGVAYNSSLVVSGGSGPYTFSIAAGSSLPGGLTLNPMTGQISGTPVVAGSTFNFTAQVVDSSGNTGSDTVSTGCAIAIPPTTGGGGSGGLTLACQSTTTGQVGTPFNASLVATGGVQPYTFSILTGTLPVPLGLNPSTGAITGTPGAPGTSTFTAKVVDSSSPALFVDTSGSCGVTISPAPPPIVSGDAATIGFWHNKNGQALILALNGSASSKSLANWLASSFPYLYGVHSSNDLTNQTNTAVAALFIKFFGAGGQKTDAQVMAGALASYVTSSTLASSTATKYGFNSSSGGTGGKAYNVGANGTALGLANNTSYTVLQLLQQANLMEKNGTYNANAFNTVFNDINTTGDIS